jgi:hypothetical protein
MGDDLRFKLVEPDELRETVKGSWLGFKGSDPSFRPEQMKEEHRMIRRSRHDCGLRMHRAKQLAQKAMGLRGGIIVHREPLIHLIQLP